MMIERDVTRERFLAAIAEKVSVASIAEAHLFQPMRQGGVESGVAVVAVEERSAVEPTLADVATPQEQPNIGEAGDESTPRDSQADGSEPSPEGGRMAVYTAKYRLTLKGPERGKWDFAMHAEGDAPLITVDKVVQGVQRRSGDAEEPVKLSGEEFGSILESRITVGGSS